jgi:plastocyanin
VSCGRTVRWLGAIAVVVVAASCGSSGSAKSSPKTSSASGTAITIQNFAFHPETLTAKPGTRVSVRNRDGTDHTVTADDRRFDTGHVTANGAATFMVTKTGTVSYHCDIHNYMHGVIHVTS